MKTIVEAGHFYQVNGPSLLSIKGWEIGKEFAANHQDAEMALFIDDYHQEQAFLEPGDEFLAADEAAHAASALVSEADHLFSEAAFAKAAPQKINELLDKSLAKLKKGVLSAGGVRLGSLRRR